MSSARPPVRLAHRRPSGFARPGQPAGRFDAMAEAGSGVLSATFGIMAFIGFLFFAVQLIYNLYATSTVTATAYDAARSVAASGPNRKTPDEACAQMKTNLGAYGKNVRCTWESNADTVRLHVHADNPNFVLFFRASLPFTHLDRTVQVRVEKQR